jgi:UDP-2,3-diacylglucosamine pyrophosphatase LpxH
MLVIVSDLHLSDGSSGETVSQGTLRVFREWLRALAYEASWRVDGKYKPIEGFDIVLLGDILDVLRSSQWFEDPPGSRIRPWENPRCESLARKVSQITQGILSQNEAFFALLREVRVPSVTSLPPATRDGAPAKTATGRRSVKRLPLQVRIHYMVGNHDWFYHLPEGGYRETRRSIVKALALENDPRRPFPHDPEEPEADVIREIFAQHQVFARHGDIYDSANFEGDRNRSSMGDAIAIELVARFGFELKRHLGDFLPAECLAGLNEIDNVRPLAMIPVWVAGLLQRTCPDQRLRSQVLEIWNETVDQMLRIPFIRERLSFLHPAGKVRKLKWVLTLSKKLIASDNLPWLIWLGERVGRVRSSYMSYAIRERAFHSHRARFIVYGHTHHHEVVPLHSSFTRTGLFDQIYINSGTWRPLHELAQYDSGRAAFVGYNTMTYLAFFKEDERNGRRFECWSGALSGAALQGTENR